MSRRGPLPDVASSLVFPYLEAMELHLTSEQEAQLAHIATEAGTDLEHLVKDTILRLLQGETSSRLPVPELPAWHLGTIGSLQRRDIYNDVR